MNFSKIVACLTILISTFSIPTSGPAQDKNVKISISGSDTMNLLSQAFAEEYMKKNPGVEISVRGGGSGVGIRDLTDGLVDIAQASRSMKDSEKKQAVDNGYEPQEHIVGLDGIVVAVNVDSPVKELTLNQVAAIFTGTVTKWNQLDPSFPDQKISLISRETSSGTYDFFKEHVLKKKDFATSTVYLGATSAVANSVAADKNAIGFGGLAFFVRVEKVRIVKIKKDKDSPAVAPVTADGKHADYTVIQNGTYPIARTLQYYTRQKADGEIAKFLTWMVGEEGQKIVEAKEYIPLGKNPVGHSGEVSK